jgi:hypothetical protein
MQRYGADGAPGRRWFQCRVPFPVVQAVASKISRNVSGANRRCCDAIEHIHCRSEPSRPLLRSHHPTETRRTERGDRTRHMRPAAGASSLPRLRLLAQSQGLRIWCQDGYSRWPASGAVDPTLDHPPKSLGLAVSDRSIRGVAEIGHACSQLWSAIIASRPMRPPRAQPVSGAATTKTGVSRGSGADPRGQLSRSRTGTHHVHRDTADDRSVEIFRRLGLSAETTACALRRCTVALMSHRLASSDQSEIRH